MLQKKRSVGLGLFRMVICLLIIKNMCFYLPMADELFGSAGIFPYNSYLQMLDIYHIGFLAYPFSIPFASQLMIFLIMLLASAYMLGYGGRVSGVLLIVALFILKFRNGFVLDGSDNVMQVTLPFLLIADDQIFFRYKPVFRNHSFSDSLFAFSWGKIKDVALLALMIQVCLIYFFTALAKFQGSLWLNGTAVYYTMRVRDFMATSFNIPLTRNHVFVVLTTYSTMMWEISFPFLIWFRQTKFYVIAVGVLFHVGIWIFMRIDNFSWIMIGTYFVFLSDREYSLIVSAFRSPPIFIFIDTWCRSCLRAGKVIRTLDLFNLVRLEDARAIRGSNYSCQIDGERAVNEMAGLSQSHRIFYGFDTIFQLTLRLPLLWVALPFMALLKITSAGNLLYRELAIKRDIIPIHCKTDCEIIKTDQNHDLEQP